MKSLKRSAITAACLAGVLTLTATPAAAIVDGQQATRSYPGMAALSIPYPGLGTLQCGASLITPRHILTAAHCVSDFTVAPTVVPVAADRITFRIGSNSRTSGGHVAIGAKVLIHPEWAWLQDTGRPIADIALVVLDHPVRSSLLPVAVRQSAGGPVRLIGWGLTEFPVPAGTPLPELLRQRDVSRLPASDCSGGGIGAGEICVSPGACFGDSGSPALHQPFGRHTGRAVVSVGVASRETNAEDPCGSPTVYTDTAFYARWIATTIITGEIAPGSPPKTRVAQSETPGKFSYLITMS